MVAIPTSPVLASQDAIKWRAQQLRTPSKTAVDAVRSPPTTPMVSTVVILIVEMDVVLGYGSLNCRYRCSLIAADFFSNSEYGHQGDAVASRYRSLGNGVIHRGCSCVAHVPCLQ